MRVLIGCEHSGVIRDKFIAAGHDAWSCDLLPTEVEGPHHQGDIFDIIDNDWDLAILHPPCTDIAVSGAAHFAKKIADGRQQRALDFVTALWDSPIPKMCIENPVSVISTKTKLGKCTQMIQPYQFGHPESKRTCLWLKNLPKLVPTDILPKPECGYWENQTPSGQNKLGPSKDRWQLRSKTYQGIAEAMATRWGLGMIPPL